MRKYAVSFLVVAIGFVAVAPAGVHGQTSTIQSQLDAISALTKQIQDLQNQIKSLQQKSVELQVQQRSQFIELVKSLRQGSSGNDVSVLQALLAADSDIYPEGLITGYYGFLTAKAVMRFQAKHGIEQLGIVGPKTLKKLNEALKENKLNFEDDDKDEDSSSSRSRLCVILPPGHLIAKGWLKKNEKPLIPVCQILPPGIDKKVDDDDDDDDDNHATSTDTFAPVISAVSASGVTHNEATATWTTNELANSKVYYSTASPVDPSSAPAVSKGSMVLSHSVKLGTLSASTTYYFFVQSTDAFGNRATSTPGSFTTLPAPDTSAPIISAVSVTNVSSTSATVNWTTNENSTSKVYYGTETPVNFGTAAAVESNLLIAAHSLNLSGLNASTTYYFAVESKDLANNTATSSQSSFTTIP